MCLVLLLQLRRKLVCQMYVWDAYLATTLLRCLFDKRLIGTLDWQVHDRKLIWRVQGFRSLFGKCIVGKPMLDAAAAPKSQKDTKNTQKSLPKYQFWKPKCFKIASWSPIFLPSRVWSQNGTTTQVHPNIFWGFWVLQGVAKTAQNQ